MAGKEKNKKLEEHEYENYYLLWWSGKGHFPYNCLSPSDEDNSADNFVNATEYAQSYQVTFMAQTYHSLDAQWSLVGNRI